MNFSDQIECCEAIGKTLANAAPSNWNKIIARIALDGDRIDAVVSYTLDTNVEGHLSGIPMLARYFYELARLVSSEEKGLFKQCLFTLNCNGKYDAKYIY